MIPIPYTFYVYIQWEPRKFGYLIMFGFHFLLIRLSGKTDVLFENTKIKASAIQPSLSRIASIKISRIIIKNQGVQMEPNRQYCATLQDKTTTPNQEKAPNIFHLGFTPELFCLLRRVQPPKRRCTSDWIGSPLSVRSELFCQGSGRC